MPADTAPCAPASAWAPALAAALAPEETAPLNSEPIDEAKPAFKPTPTDASAEP